MRTLIVLLLCSSSVAQAAKVAVLSTELEGKAKDEVPSLVDDYVLTAVQDLGDHEVIGPNDVSAVIGFEKEKELLGCDDVACMADIAGALGVDQIVVFKVARVGSDWATTAKLIDIRNTRVEARTTDFVPGSARDLLGAIPRLMADLFNQESAPATPAATPAPTAHQTTLEPKPQAAGPTTPPSEGEPIYTSPWFWVAIGAATATAVVVGIIVAKSGADETSDMDPTYVGGGALVSW